MGVLDNISKRFYMTIGKPEKVYPVSVEKYKRRGDDWVKVKDRGRTVTKEKGKVFELMKENHIETNIPYSAFDKTSSGTDEATVLMPERDTVVPAKKNIKVEAEEGETKGSIDLVVDIEAWENWAEQEFQDSAKIVETDEEAWWQDKTVQAMMIFFGAGLFFVFVGVGYSYAINEAVIQELQKLRGTVESREAAGAATSLAMLKLRGLNK